jgi:hypothetical protein
VVEDAVRTPGRFARDAPDGVDVLDAVAVPVEDVRHDGLLVLVSWQEIACRMGVAVSEVAVEVHQSG